MSEGTSSRIVVAVEGMHCASCGLLIDDIVEELPGVLSSATDVRAARTVVTLAEGASLDPATVTKAIDGAGYTARVEEARDEERS